MARAAPLLALAATTASPHPAARPPAAAVTWASGPAAPNDTVLLTGHFPGGAGSALLLAGAEVCAAGGRCASAAVQQPSAVSAKVVLPADLPLDAFNLTLGAGLTVALNEPEAFTLGCHGAARPCAPGDLLAVHGRALAFGGGGCLPDSTGGGALAPRPPQLSLTSAGGAVAIVPALDSPPPSCYSATFALPPGLPPGNFTLSLRSNLPSSRFTPLPADLRTLAVAAAPAWNPRVFKVNAASRAALLAAVEQAGAAGGGRVALPAGTIAMAVSDRILLRNRVVLVGAGAGETVLKWPSQTGNTCYAAGPGNGLIQGANTTDGFAVQDLGVIVTGGIVGSTWISCSVVHDCSPAGGSSDFPCRGMRLQNVAISVVAEETGYNTSAGAGAYMGMGPAIRVSGQHFVIDSVSVTHSGDCGLNVAGALKLVNTRGGLIRNSVVQYGAARRSRSTRSAR